MPTSNLSLHLSDALAKLELAIDQTTDSRLLSDLEKIRCELFDTIIHFGLEKKTELTILDM